MCLWDRARNLWLNLPWKRPLEKATGSFYRCSFVYVICIFRLCYAYILCKCMHFFKNIHLVAKWLGSLEKLLECCCENSHQDYRVFMSAEPSPTPQEHIIPQGILENSIKITNEPPTGMLANLHAALDNFDQVNNMNKRLRMTFLHLFLFLSCCAGGSTHSAMLLV